MTNGKRYRFYAEKQKINELDEKPFLDFDLSEVNDKLIQCLSQFSRQNYNPKRALELSTQWNSTARIYTYLKEQFSAPSDHFSKFLSNSIFNSVKPELVEDIKTVLRNTGLVFVNSDDTIPPDPIEFYDEENPFEVEFAKRQDIEYFRFQNNKINGRLLDIYVHVFRYLYKEDSMKLKQISRSIVSLKITDNPDLLKRPEKISTYKYIETNFSTKDKMRLLEGSLKAFNMEDTLRVKLRNKLFTKRTYI